MKSKKVNGVYIVRDSKSQTRPKGETLIKADMILNAWQSYRRTSRIYRLFEFFGLR